MKALRRFTVRVALPAPLAGLDELVNNLRWSWHDGSIDLFESIDPALWLQVAGDPVRLLGEVSSARLRELAEDEAFLGRLDGVVADLRAYMASDRWYQSLPDAPASIAYFSPEFGITETLPQYSGGLGILAGDHLKTASDLGVPIIGVGLFYEHGYFAQSLSADGWQQERYPPLDPQGLPISLIRHEDGTPLVIDIAFPGDRSLRAHVWKAQVGRVPLLLLDSNIEENAPSEREICDRLYGGGTEHRLQQEILLGVGGVRAVRAYCAISGTPYPEVFHTNEGHAGFLGVERIREFVDEHKLTFDEALTAARAGTVFTTHTPVPAGIDRFPRELIRQYFSSGLQGSLPVERILALGAEPVDGDPHVFNMALMGLRLGQRANGVSLLHGIVSRGMFAGLWPGFDTHEVPIQSITNGVHAATWMSRETLALLNSDGDYDALDEPSIWEKLDRTPDADLWALRRSLRGQLVDEVRRRTKASWHQRGAADAELSWVDSMFDPDALTIGFARRVPSYKRLTLMLRDPARLTALLTDPLKPVQIVIAGKAHPADDGGKALVQEIVKFADGAGVRHRIVFLPDYDIGMARVMLPGCDVWLNNPLRPLEASGTSGMKSALNGGLNLSIMDGWWDEMFDRSSPNGWAIPSSEVEDPDRRDDLEAHSLYHLIESEVAHHFYDRDANGLPVYWIQMVRHALRSLGPQVLASRMVKQYVNELYAPAARSSRELAKSSFATAKTLAAWLAATETQWPSVRVTHVETSLATDSPDLGSSLPIRAVVDLGKLSPTDVVVQAVYGRVNDADEFVYDAIKDVCAAAADMKFAGKSDDGLYRFEGEVPLGRTGPFGYTVRVLPHNDLLIHPAETRLVATA
ncbi:MAG: alpha-glucan phosphorylase [Frankiales bacterium]|nr:alpha-glucan phosphorylase [Frankiales bacterium]